MKRSKLCEKYTRGNDRFVPWHHISARPSWILIETDMSKPITPPLILKRTTNET